MKKLTKSMKEIKLDKGEVLMSYRTPVAFIDRMGQAYRTSEFWSVTTSRHITRWLLGTPSTTMPQSFFDALYKEAV